MTAPAPPAGGSPLDQVLIATTAATVVLVALISAGLAARKGRPIPLLGRAERLAASVMGIPGWAALPIAVAAGALLTAVFGLYWDISLHLDKGRDPGPLANASHYFILAGLLGIFSAGWLAVVLPQHKPGPAAIRISGDWWAPVGGVLMIVCSSFASIGFPLDDLWHRLFGQDVTLWGPTHLMMLTGAALTLVGILILHSEGMAARERRRSFTLIARRPVAVLACGGLLAGFSIYQGEFDFGVPQFRLLHQPALLALAAGGSLVAARLLGGRGGALGAALFFVVVRGALTLIVSGVLGRSVAHFPLFLAEALCVEAIAVWLGTARRGRFALACGLAIGALGTLAEFGWSHVWMPQAWPAHLLPAAFAVAIPMAVAGATLSAYLVGGLKRQPAGRGAAAAALATVVAVIGVLLQTGVPQARAVVDLRDVTSGPQRSAQATVRLVPADAADGADWIRSIAWQGGGRVVTEALRRVGPGVYRTTTPLPLYGEWKSGIRLHNGALMGAVPLYMPADPAIPAPAVAAPAHFERVFVNEHVLLQRERRADVAPWLWTAGTLVVVASILVLLIFVGWALQRLGSRPASRPEPAAAVRVPAGAAA